MTLYLALQPTSTPNPTQLVGGGKDYQRKLQRVRTSTSTIGVPDAASILLLAQGQPIYSVYNTRSTKCCCPCASNNMLEAKMCFHGQFQAPSMACANLGQQVPIASNFATWLTAVPCSDILVPSAQDHSMPGKASFCVLSLRDRQ